MISSFVSEDSEVSEVQTSYIQGHQIIDGLLIIDKIISLSKKKNKNYVFQCWFWEGILHFKLDPFRLYDGANVFLIQNGKIG